MVRSSTLILQFSSYPQPVIQQQRMPRASLQDTGCQWKGKARAEVSQREQSIFMLTKAACRPVKAGEHFSTADAVKECSTPAG